MYGGASLYSVSRPGIWRAAEVLIIQSRTQDFLTYDTVTLDDKATSIQRRKYHDTVDTLYHDLSRKLEFYLRASDDNRVLSTLYLPDEVR